MPNDKIDADTFQVLSDAEEVRNMLASRGWAIAKAKLDTIILDLQNIANIDLSKPDTLSMQLMSRLQASTELFNWQKDLYDTVNQAEVNGELMKNTQDESPIVRR